MGYQYNSYHNIAVQNSNQMPVEVQFVQRILADFKLKWNPKKINKNVINFSF